MDNFTTSIIKDTERGNNYEGFTFQCRKYYKIWLTIWNMIVLYNSNRQLFQKKVTEQVTVSALWVLFAQNFNEKLLDPFDKSFAYLHLEKQLLFKPTLVY